MQREEYGSKYQEHLLEQYKLYVQIMDNTTVQRGNTNKFYITVLSSLLAILTFFINNNFPEVLLIIISAFGILLCYTWRRNIKSYKQLNSGRFKVIVEIEKELPFPSFTEEWKYLKRGSGETYTRLTEVEQQIPIYLAIPYLTIFCYFIFDIIACK